MVKSAKEKLSSHFRLMNTEFSPKKYSKKKSVKKKLEKIFWEKILGQTYSKKILTTFSFHTKNPGEKIVREI